jgi:hypothetical protein
MRLATSEEEKEAVYRFRYDVYVVEMGRSSAATDHDNRRLVELEDETARIWYAAQDGEVVATHRFSWGDDAPFSERLIDNYRATSLARWRSCSSARVRPTSTRPPRVAS